uniref:aminomethyltransferase beta-barrel domain-containing protein n=1 Tax=Planotetraspora mira TaxID=58121 RepID=UPI0036713E4D
MEVTAKVRYSARPAKAKLTQVGENKIKLVFEENQRAITKGQSVVFYKGNYVVGGGIIEEIL